MNPVHFNAIGAKVVYNALYDDPDPSLRAQDISLLQLADKTYVDVGWYPQFDPNGTFVITHYKGDWDHIVKTICTPRVSSVVETVDDLARNAIARRPRTASGTGKSTSVANYNPPFVRVA